MVLNCKFTKRGANLLLERVALADDAVEFDLRDRRLALLGADGSDHLSGGSVASERALVVRESAPRDCLELRPSRALGHELLDEHFSGRLLHEVDELTLVQTRELHELLHFFGEVLLLDLQSKLERRRVDILTLHPYSKIIE